MKWIPSKFETRNGPAAYSPYRSRNFSKHCSVITRKKPIVRKCRDHRVSFPRPSPPKKKEIPSQQKQKVKRQGPTDHPPLLPPKMKSILDHSLVSLLNPVYVAKFPDTFRLGVWPRTSTSLKSKSSSGCWIGYFALKLEGMASGDAVPVRILYAPESSPFDELLV